MRDTRLVVGSESQLIEGLNFVSGIQRVVRETHVTLIDALSPHGFEIVPLHTRPLPRRREFRQNPYLAADPVLEKTPVSPDEVDVFLFVDANGNADFPMIHRDIRRRPRPVISVIYDVIPLLHREWYDGDMLRPFRAYVQQVLAISDVVVVNSEKVRSDILSLGWRLAGEIRVIPLGSSFRERRPETPPDDRLSLLYVSTVEPRKGHDILLGAFDLLRASGFDVDLSIVGRHGWLAREVAEDLYGHPDFGGRLRWYEGADDASVAAVARSSTVGVFPTMEEGFGLFLEEGLAYGLKMVVSDIPVFRERPGANVYYSERTALAFAGAIEKAHRAPWVKPAPVRTMRDFGYDLADLLREVLR